MGCGNRNGESRWIRDIRRTYVDVGLGERPCMELSRGRCPGFLLGQQDGWGGLEKEQVCAE